MDSSLPEVWQAAAGSPFFPTVSKGSQFWVAFFLLLLGFSLTGVFALSKCHDSHLFFCLLTGSRPHNRQRSRTRHSSLYRHSVRCPSTVHHLLNYLLSTVSEWSICSVRSESTSKIPKSPHFDRF